MSDDEAQARRSRRLTRRDCCGNRDFGHKRQEITGHIDNREALLVQGAAQSLRHAAGRLRVHALRPNALAHGRDACGASIAATGYASSDD